MPEPADDKPSLTWASVIPEAAYDIVARVLPGIVFVAAALNTYACFRSWILQRPIHWMELNKDLPTFGLVSAVIMLCWILGLLLTPFGDFLWRGGQRERIFLETVAKNSDLFFRAETAGIIQQKHTASLWKAGDGESTQKNRIAVSADVYQQMHEYLKDRSELWRGLLSKTQAEVTFYANVSAALILAILGEMLFTLIAWYALPPGQLHFSRPSVLAYLAISLGPALLLLYAAVQGQKQKQQRLWSRHIALLVIDLKDSTPLPADDNWMG